MKEEIMGKGERPWDNNDVLTNWILDEIKEEKEYKIIKKPAGIIDRIEAKNPKEALSIFLKNNPGFEMNNVIASR